MHYPERWGYLRFAEQEAKKHDDFTLPSPEALKKYLWLVYYMQKGHMRRHGKYAVSLSQLQLPSNIPNVTGNECTLQLTSAAHDSAPLLCVMVKKQAGKLIRMVKSFL